MTASLSALAAKPVPAYCSNLLKTPAQWKACWDAGWQQGGQAGAHAGAVTGHFSAPILIGLLILAALFVLTRRRSPATS